MEVAMLIVFTFGSVGIIFTIVKLTLQITQQHREILLTVATKEDIKVAIKEAIEPLATKEDIKGVSNRIDAVESRIESIESEIQSIWRSGWFVDDPERDKEGDV